MIDNLHPNILRDAGENPVAVQIPYDEWLQILAVLKPMIVAPKEDVTLNSYVGSLHFEGDPVEWQRKMREEWE